MISGTLYGIGIGPGDPELITYTHLTRGYFFSNHASNYLPIKAKLPGGKQKALDLIDSALRGEVGLKPEWMRAL